MPFVPIKPNTQTPEYEEPCRDPEHNPPGMIDLKEPSVWVCPTCGKEVFVRPPLKGKL